MDTIEKPSFKPKTPSIYPSLVSNGGPDKVLAPTDQILLANQATHYCDNDNPWDLTAPVLNNPPPYNPKLPVSAAVSLQLNDFLPSSIRQAKLILSQEVSSLKDILQHKWEHLQLVKEI